MPRLKGSADLLEDRRRRALALLDDGLSLNEVGRRMRCAPSSVLRWRKARWRGGPDALRVRFSPGRPSKLTETQRRRLVKVLLQGPLAHGYRTHLWTTQRIAEVIWRKFRVRYHRDHVGRLMHRLSWTHQKPQTRAVERQEETIARWKRTEWPRVKKTPRGWAPRGQTPVFRHSYRRDRISVISAVSVSPKRQHLGLYYQLWFGNIGQEEVCLFLRHLLRHLRGPVIALLDNSPTHKGQPLVQLLRQHPRLHLEVSPLTRRTSIPMRAFGLWRSATSPMAAPRTLTNS